MSWGTGPWGSGSPWGTGAALPPPTLIAITSDPGPTASTSSPAVVAERGGTICTLVGTNFADPMTVEILRGGGGAYTVVAEGYIFDPRYDIQRGRCYVGAPALEVGLYSVRVTTAGGTSGVLADVLASRRFAEEFKTLSVRGKWAPVWATGPRLLRG